MASGAMHCCKQDGCIVATFHSSGYCARHRVKHTDYVVYVAQSGCPWQEFFRTGNSREADEHYVRISRENPEDAVKLVREDLILIREA